MLTKWLKRFLMNMVNMAEYGEIGNSALHFAVKYSYVDVVKALVHGGADVNQRNNKRYSAVDFASFENHKEIILALKGTVLM